MIRTKLFLACALAFVLSSAGASASAQEPSNQITYFTFSAPFELPGGKTLPAGKYVFRIVDSPSNRHIVQVLSEDQQTMHATLLAVPAERQQPPDEPEVRFMETAANQPPAIRTWWYPGRSIGHEFIYPKDHARRLAARQREGVLTVAGDATGDDAVRTGNLARIGADGQETAWNANSRPTENTSAQSTAAQSRAGAQTSTAQSTATTGQTTQTGTAPGRSAAAPTTPRTARTALPRTASPLPLIGLLGLGSLIGAGALRLRRERSGSSLRR